MIIYIERYRLWYISEEALLSSGQRNFRYFRSGSQTSYIASSKVSILLSKNSQAILREFENMNINSILARVIVVGWSRHFFDSYSFSPCRGQFFSTAWFCYKNSESVQQRTNSRLGFRAVRRWCHCCERQICVSKFLLFVIIFFFNFQYFLLCS